MVACVAGMTSFCLVFGSPSIEAMSSFVIVKVWPVFSVGIIVWGLMFFATQRTDLRSSFDI